ncbi:MAG: hypothetical protein E6R03_16485 [Hyphomicrobiaceae bacterium]|nr:MAG: hypothetical protein E6R03_16485 [Hyphomicrobiaceae bacterium]
MKITEITVTAARTFNHPYEQYSNLRPEVVLRATLDEGEDVNAATRALQAKAEGLVEDHKRGMLKSIEELYQLNLQQQEMQGLERTLRGAQQRIEEIRKQNPGLSELCEGTKRAIGDERA